MHETYFKNTSTPQIDRLYVFTSYWPMAGVESVASLRCLDLWFFCVHCWFLGRKKKMCNFHPPTYVALPKISCHIVNCHPYARCAIFSCSPFSKDFHHATNCSHYEDSIVINTAVIDIQYNKRITMISLLSIDDEIECLN